MQAEYNALLANDWTPVSRPPSVNVVTAKWVFRHKFRADGSLDRYKARWVLRGFTQRPVSIMMRYSVQLSSQPQSEWFSHWLRHALGLFMSWMSRMLFFMVR